MLCMLIRCCTSCSSVLPLVDVCPWTLTCINVNRWLSAPLTLPLCCLAISLPGSRGRPRLRGLLRAEELQQLWQILRGQVYPHPSRHHHRRGGGDVRHWDRGLLRHAVGVQSGPWLCECAGRAGRYSEGVFSNAAQGGYVTKQGCRVGCKRSQGKTHVTEIGFPGFTLWTYPANSVILLLDLVRYTAKCC